MKHGASGNLLCIRWFVSVSLTVTLEVSWINSKTEYEKSLFSASQWKRIICVNCRYNGKKIPTSILLAKYLCYLLKRNEDYFKLISELMLEQKKIVHFGRIANLTLFICLIDWNFPFSFGALKEQDHSWTHFLRNVTSLLSTVGLWLLYFFNWSLPLDSQASFLLRSHISKPTRLLTQELCLK